MPKYACAGGCVKHVSRRNGPLSYCPTCFYLEETLRKESATNVAELRERRDLTVGRITDLLLRTGVDDAPHLIRRLEKL